MGHPYSIQILANLESPRNSRQLLIFSHEEVLRKMIGFGTGFSPESGDKKQFLKTELVF